MYLHLFFLLFSSGVSSYVLPLKEMPHLQNKTQYAIIDEMLCLLEAEKEPIKMRLLKPLHIKNQNCAHFNTENFIQELEKISTCKCMKMVEKYMRKLEEKCSILKKSLFSDQKCFEMAITNFSQFKESLEEFLKWVNAKQYCSNTLGSELDLYPDGQCSCPDSWKYHKGFF